MKKNEPCDYRNCNQHSTVHNKYHHVMWWWHSQWKDLKWKDNKESTPRQEKEMNHFHSMANTICLTKQGTRHMQQHPNVTCTHSRKQNNASCIMLNSSSSTSFSSIPSSLCERGDLRWDAKLLLEHRWKKKDAKQTESGTPPGYQESKKEKSTETKPQNKR